MSKNQFKIEPVRPGSQYPVEYRATASAAKACAERLAKRWTESLGRGPHAVNVYRRDDSKGTLGREAHWVPFAFFTPGPDGGWSLEEAEADLEQRLIEAVQQAEQALYAFRAERSAFKAQ